MKVLYITGSRIVVDNGVNYADASLCAIINRYYDTFKSVSVLGKTSFRREAQNIRINDNIRVLQSGTTIDTLLHRNTERIEKEILDADFVILRLPSFIGYKAFKIARNNNIRYMVEVVGNAKDALWNHSLKGKLMAHIVQYQTKKCVKHADYALYVTKEYLQSIYPSNGLSAGVSDVYIKNLSQNVLQDRLKKIHNHDNVNISLVTAAAVNVRYKGHRYVIEALSILKKRGLSVKYYLAGKGDSTYLEKIAKKFGVADQVIFTGSLSREELFELIQESDFYIQPSLLEGLPRALVEAMSCGCPCIGTDVGGIPELLEEKTLVKKKSAMAIANKLEELNNLETMGYLATKNFNIALEYEEERLGKERNDFFDLIKSAFLN